MMPMAILAAALAAQILPAPGTVRWERMIEESSGASYIDPASLARDGDVVRFLNRTDRNVEGDAIRMLVVRVAIDCRRRMIGMIEGDAYGESGRFLRSIPAGPGAIAFEPLPPRPGPTGSFSASAPPGAASGCDRGGESDMMMTILLAAIAAQILPAPGTVRWEQVADESSGPSFIDPASLTRDGDVVRFVSRSDRRVVAGDGIRMLVVQAAIDCRRRMVGFSGGDAYGEGGRFLYSIPVGSGAVAFQSLPASPGVDQVFRRVCADAGRR
jgi:hypothetical protein